VLKRYLVWLKDIWCGNNLSVRDWESFINSNSRSIIMVKKKFYAVAIGRKPGIYLTWTEFQEHGGEMDREGSVGDGLVKMSSVGSGVFRVR
jgi:Caulimovirus viroplasmin